MVQNGGNVVRLKNAFYSTRFTAAVIDDRIYCLMKSNFKNNTKDGFAEEFEVFKLIKLYLFKKFYLEIV